MAPTLRNLDDYPLSYSFAKLIAPVALIFFNAFFAIFEGILNCYAEIATFGDRQFYLDFWNSTNFDDWARKWNRPVHGFLKEYLYAYVVNKFNFSSIRGYLCTIIASAILHEFVLVASV
eukprot:TRINITY_DN1792_c0_g1_i18.p3 TRINITY_DN1792_c0_g1~~TRINITY_DN1792_c0_g1_i18.p3  ORF type:complete len:119 (+),score=29.01 TRINITY_DN1792_c0_g1_i18:772-1128(+)